MDDQLSVPWPGGKMKLVTIAMVIGSLIACSGGSSGSSPTAPTATVTNASIGGSYNLTITAASACSANLPSATRALAYVADVAQTGAAFNAQLLAHVIWSHSPVVSGTVSGQTVTFSSFSFSEITTGGGVGLVSTGSATVAGNGTITGTLSGTVQTASGMSCNATNHQIQMVKR
jgi:hypothetical protein